MTGFSPQWLALREPADHRARNGALSSQVAAHFASRADLRITDLGCGSGSNLRALAPALGKMQHWQLVDYDPALLRAASEALVAWADAVRRTDDGSLQLVKGERHISVSFHQADLQRDLESVLDLPADLVTAAAFFDLVSEAWIKRFVDASVRRAIPLYTVLTYDGQETWAPSHESDADVLAAFHRHQASDKGFGAAAGPLAATALQTAFARHHWTVQTAESPWLLDADAGDAPLIRALAQGAAGAVAETASVSPGSLASWLAARECASHCRIGHVDLFARP